MFVEAEPAAGRRAIGRCGGAAGGTGAAAATGGCGGGATPAGNKAGAGLSDGNDLDIPQCWPVPIRASARFRISKPRDSFSKAPASLRSGLVLPFARSLRGRRGVQSASRVAPPVRAAGCFRCCKLRASRVLEAAQPSCSTGVSTLEPDPSRSPTSPDILDARAPLSVCFRFRRPGGSSRCRRAWRRPSFVPVPEAPSRLKGVCAGWARRPAPESDAARLFTFLILLPWRSPTSVTWTLHPACHASSERSRLPDR